MIKNFIEEIGYDQERMPLGKLSYQTINEGKEILNSIKEELDKPKKEIKKHILDELTSQFYSYLTILLKNLDYFGKLFF